MRKLASIQRIKSLTPILGADRIVEAEVMGWHCVVGKDDFKVGDFCVFFEVDSVLPERDWSEFMRDRKFRIKTMKLKGVLSQGLLSQGLLSQGLALPVSKVFPHADIGVDGVEIPEPQPYVDGAYIDVAVSSLLKEGSDVTDLAGVIKWDPPEFEVGGNGPQRGETAGSFPSLIPKTDEDRIQSNLCLLEYLKGRRYAITVKADGSSETVTYVPDDNPTGVSLEPVVCSRNQAKCPPCTFWDVAVKYKLDAVLRGTTFALQGELCGPGIQKNKLCLKEHDLFIFNMYDWKAGRRVKHDDMAAFCAQYGVKMVEVLEVGDNFNYTLEELLEKAKGWYPEQGVDGKPVKKRREGIVVRSNDDGMQVSFKVLNNDFLLKDET